MKLAAPPKIVILAALQKYCSRPLWGPWLHVENHWPKPGVPNLGYMYPQGYICPSEGVHLRLAIEEKNIFTYHFFPNIYTYISEWYIPKFLYAYCQIHLWIIMTKYFVLRDFRDTCSSVEILKGCMVVCWNAEGVHAHLSECWRSTS